MSKCFVSSFHDVPFKHCSHPLFPLSSKNHGYIPTTMRFLRRRMDQKQNTSEKTRNKTQISKRNNAAPSYPLHLLALATALPVVSAAIWNDQLKVWDIGRVDTDKSPGKCAIKPVKTMYACGGIAEGGYVCGSSEDEGVDALRAIYRCDRGRLRLREVCWESDRYNRCVKNGRRKGKNFFPFGPTEAIVCQKMSNVEKP